MDGAAGGRSRPPEREDAMGKERKRMTAGRQQGKEKRKKKLVLVTYERKAKNRYLEQLEDFFDGLIEIGTYCVDEDEGQMELSGADLLLLSFADVTGYVSPFLTGGNQIMYMTRSFEKDKLAPLAGVAGGERVGLADYSETLAFETIGILNACGYNHLEYQMIVPGCDGESMRGIRTVITTENVVTIPAAVEKVINIGYYRISWTTFAEIARRLDVLDDTVNERLNRYSQVVASPNQGIVDSIKYTWTTERQLAAVVESMNEAVIVTDLNYRIVESNSAAAALCGAEERGGKAARRQLRSVEELPGSLREFLMSAGSVTNQITTVRETGRNVVVTKKPIALYGEVQGHVFVIRSVNEIQKLENDYRIMMARKGFAARYSFDDIITVSPRMQECIEICKRIAATDLAILITGESGVGKEMFAQSIHNHSRRQAYPFVAVNCAALPRDLLESELFGFEEGSFTGARKGGKKGLFELAHKGTIFLDEIGDMPVETQAKLLRVLQEKEVMRVGGTGVIPVDVRVISASNADFNRLFGERSFRRDLYYRLNNARVRVPSLKERREDIPLLCRAFCDGCGHGDYGISGELADRLQRIHWDGNVRELKNCVEFMTALCGDGTLTLEDLPPDYRETEESRQEKRGTRETAGMPLLPEEAALAEAILGILRRRKLGRRRLKRVLEDQGVEVSEYKIKRIVDYLREENLLP